MRFKRSLLNVRPRLVAVLVLSAALYLAYGNCRAEVISSQVVGSGGGAGTVGAFATSGTIGQIAVGSGSADVYSCSQGFWRDPTAGCMCGDADGNDIFTISDAVYLINYIFAGGAAPYPLCRGDADGNGIITISDAVYLINYIFAGGPPPQC